MKASKYTKGLASTGFVLITAQFLAGCNGQTQAGYFSTMQVENEQADTSATVPSPTASASPTPSPSATVCGGLGGTNSSSGSAQDGLVASLYSFSSAPPSTVTDTVAHMIQNGTQASAALYFNQLDVPNTAFETGFPLTSGGVLTQNGSPLIEWFALDFHSQLKLGTSDPVGNYQFATFSDDGSTMQIDTGTGLGMLVNNDHEHSATVQCSSYTVPMKANSLYPIKLDYFQGPRYYIALTVLWRQVSNVSDLSDSSCGQAASNIQGMLSRGWKVLGPENYQLPGANAVNPCTTPTPSPTFPDFAGQQIDN